VYVKPTVRQGLLGRMLTELLDTRVMVKQAMKSVKGDKVRRFFPRVCRYLIFPGHTTRVVGTEPDTGRAAARAQVYRQRHIRLHGCDVFGADACGGDCRQYRTERSRDARKGVWCICLERRITATHVVFGLQAIAVIDSTEKWGARVVYGDTDSVFIYLKGKTKEQAFKTGYEIADTITAMNPAPIKLKFEKVSVMPGLQVPFSETHGVAGVLAMRAHGEEEICRV
jgi:DNA polymerase zeta